MFQRWLSRGLDSEPGDIMFEYVCICFDPRFTSFQPGKALLSIVVLSVKVDVPASPS